jgi:hypothetical protein
LGAAGHAGACGQIAGAGDLQGKHLTACCKIVFVLGDAVGFDFFFIGQAQAVFAAVFTVGVPGGALAYFERGGDVGAELDDLLDALVLGAVGVGEGAVRAGAVGSGGGVVGEDFALVAGELVACGGSVFRSFLGYFQIKIGL